jgi:HlyD family secretion protein
VEVEVSTEEFERTLAQADGGRAVLRPGLPAQVVVPTRSRTALQYLLEPLTQTMWSSFRQE